MTESTNETRSQKVARVACDLLDSARSSCSHARGTPEGETRILACVIVDCFLTLEKALNESRMLNKKKGTPSANQRPQ